MKKVRLTIGPAASALGTSVLTPPPARCKQSIATTSVTMNGSQCAGPCTP